MFIENIFLSKYAEFNSKSTEELLDKWQYLNLENGEETVKQNLKMINKNGNYFRLDLLFYFYCPLPYFLYLSLLCE